MIEEKSRFHIDSRTIILSQNSSLLLLLTATNVGFARYFQMFYFHRNNTENTYMKYVTSEMLM